MLCLLAEDANQRAMARLLGINLKTVARKLVFLAEQARLKHFEYLEELKASGLAFEEIQFDEMETFERTKCLPLSIPLIVEPKTRKIIGFEVASMPAKGPLAEFSRKKYGRRPDDRRKSARSLLAAVKEYLAQTPVIRSDENPMYPSWIKESLEGAIHQAEKGERGCSTAQGELKKTRFDPLFAFNHTAAMIRAHVSRMARKTWCTTKRPDRLVAHLWIYVFYHNTVLTESG